LTIRQCQIINNNYCFEKASMIVKRYRSMFLTKKVGTN